MYRSVFETTIRYIGGFLSAYELSGEKFPILVEKAKEVADKMAFAWVNVSEKDAILVLVNETGLIYIYIYIFI